MVVDPVQALLHELRSEGVITARTAWRSIYPRVANEERFRAALAQPGSTPIELFWDVVDELDVQLEEKVARVEAVLKRKEFKPTEETTREEFEQVVKGEVDLEERDITLVFDEVRVTTSSF